MGKILHFIAKETQGECFTSFKYCYDNVAAPMFAKPGTDAAHHRVCSFRTLPKQLHVSGETHQTFIAACIRIDSVKVFHVWFPSICQYLLLLLEDSYKYPPNILLPTN